MHSLVQLRVLKVDAHPLASPKSQDSAYVMRVFILVRYTTLVTNCLLIILPLTHIHRRCPRSPSVSTVSLALVWYIHSGNH